MSDLFEEKAKDWDVNEMVQQLSSAVGECIVTNLELTPQMHVMDFGAGTGLIASQVAPRVKKITAVDVSQAMLDQLLKKLNSDNNNNIDILCQNILNEPTGENYDLIVSAMAMHHVEDTDKMLQQFSRHLKPGAKVALADLDKEDGSFHPEDVEGVFHHGFERADFQTALEKAGFKDINILTAHTVLKNEKSYPVFLCIATKK